MSPPSMETRHVNGHVAANAVAAPGAAVSAFAMHDAAGVDSDAHVDPAPASARVAAAMTPQTQPVPPSPVALHVVQRRASGPESRPATATAAAAAPAAAQPAVTPMPSRPLQVAQRRAFVPGHTPAAMADRPVLSQPPAAHADAPAFLARSEVAPFVQRPAIPGLQVQPLRVAGANPPATHAGAHGARAATPLATSRAPTVVQRKATAVAPGPLTPAAPAPPDLLWRHTSVATAPVASTLASQGPAAVIQRQAGTSDSSASSNAPAAPAATTPAVRPSTAPDPVELALRELTRRLTIEQERRGGGRWR
jgi:hypothetical protein